MLVAAARDSDQTIFDQSDRLPDDDGAVFVTAVPDAPLQVCGRLGRDGRWYIGTFMVVPFDRSADEISSSAALATASRAHRIVHRPHIGSALIARAFRHSERPQVAAQGRS